MYAIIYWETDERVFAVQNDNATLKIFETLGEADKEAENWNDSRVISIEAVQD